MINLGTLLFTWMKGRQIGTDTQGNRYYTEKSVAKGRRTRRWVIYNGKVDASRIPAEWHAWLHHTSDHPLTDVSRAKWQKPHQANATGSAGCYLPPGHDLRGGQRERAAGDYEAWQP